MCHNLLFTDFNVSMKSKCVLIFYSQISTFTNIFIHRFQRLLIFLFTDINQLLEAIHLYHNTSIQICLSFSSSSQTPAARTTSTRGPSNLYGRKLIVSRFSNDAHSSDGDARSIPGVTHSIEDAYEVTDEV